MEKMIKEDFPTCQELLGYAPFRPGVPPRILAKTKPDRYGLFSLKGKEGEAANQAIEIARDAANVQPLWILRHDEAKAKCSSCGVAIVTTKLIVLPAGGEFRMGAGVS